MAIEQARFHKATGAVDWTSDAAIPAGEVKQLLDGRAAVYAGLNAAASGDKVTMRTAGQYKVKKNTSVVFLAGQTIYWDESASQADISVTGDFPVGIAVEDATAAATQVLVDLNQTTIYDIDLRQGEWTTAAALGEGITLLPGGAVKASLDAIGEIAMAACYSVKTIPWADDWIFETEIAIYNGGDVGGGVVDISCGMANGTHATDFDSVTESALIHMDGNNVNIFAESDDGTTEVAATDTTVDYVDDTYFVFTIDGRNLADLQYYINGVNVLPSSVFKLNAATGPGLPIVHIEKSDDDTPVDVRVSRMSVWAAAA